MAPHLLEGLRLVEVVVLHHQRQLEGPLLGSIQSGIWASAGVPSIGMRVSAVPSGRITFSHGANRMYCPPGDHTANCPNVLVRRYWWVPSAFITDSVCQCPKLPVGALRQTLASE